MIRFDSLDPLMEMLRVLESTVRCRAAFEPIAKEIIEVDASGLSSSGLARLTLPPVRRPIVPLDPEVSSR